MPARKMTSNLVNVLIAKKMAGRVGEVTRECQVHFRRALDWSELQSCKNKTTNPKHLSY